MRFTLLSTIFLSTPLYAFDGKININYEATFLGLTVATGEVRSTFINSQFKTAINARSGGIGKLFAGGSMTVQTSGTLIKDRLLTKSYATQIQNKKENPSIKFDVIGDKVSNLVKLPVKEPNPTVVPLTDAHLRNILDPSSATVLVINGTAPLLSPASCNTKTQSVFDGTIRYDLTFAYDRTEQVETEGYKGEAIKCRVKLNNIAGYRTDKPIAKDNEKVPVYVWLVPVNNTRMMMPYKIQVQTKYGKGEMVAAKMDIGY